MKKINLNNVAGLKHAIRVVKENDFPKKVKQKVRYIEKELKHVENSKLPKHIKNKKKKQLIRKFRIALENKPPRKGRVYEGNPRGNPKNLKRKGNAKGNPANLKRGRKKGAKDVRKRKKRNENFKDVNKQNQRKKTLKKNNKNVEGTLRNRRGNPTRKGRIKVEFDKNGNVKISGIKNTNLPTLKRKTFSSGDIKDIYDMARNWNDINEILKEYGVYDKWNEFISGKYFEWIIRVMNECGAVIDPMLFVAYLEKLATASKDELDALVDVRNDVRATRIVRDFSKKEFNRKWIQFEKNSRGDKK